ncbi:hypothetical protein K5X82_02850 [Halosquirtibacter xylanolyticus]|uniref:hypothetical protein n=1 Tax=Halosquirtibacter xylanolyticus TaxID=3374599 RepID=UPI0037484DB1|nr:hypothetical protein K5X82_02850 [Prolixibacteraceae bacterium]
MKNSQMHIFSATGNTQRIAQFVMSKIDDAGGDVLNDLVLIGCPIYKGRVPVDYMQWLEEHPFSNRKVILVLSYGNGHIDDAVLELYDWARLHQNHVIGAVAMVSPHSYSTVSHPIAEERPTKDEWNQLEKFAAVMIDKLQKGDLNDIKVDGNHPYKELISHAAIQPQKDTTRCCECGQCEEVCAMIHPEKLGLKDIQVSQCLMCGACIKCCPTEAISFEGTDMMLVLERVRGFCATPKPSLFIQ